MILFTKLFQLLIETYPAQRSIGFMFDDKPEVAPYALEAYTGIKSGLNRLVPDYLTTIALGDDAKHPPLQAADLLAYEWRKRISDERRNKAGRDVFQRLRASRSEGALWRYGRSVFDEAMKVDPVIGDQSMTYYLSVRDGKPTHYD